MSVNYVYNSVLTLEEKILLQSLEETDTTLALRELEHLMMFVSTDTEGYEVIASLNEKLRKEHINITEELKELEDEDMELYDVT
ncbi:MAG TPA: hypothetical protein PLH98_13340 [Ruminococcus flavefaciens]|nr:hypothetical protein [Ruminococcus flavefaciens]HQM01517.1 hypothetical protein [Ruminococcus flavefaciens]